MFLHDFIWSSYLAWVRRIVSTRAVLIPFWNENYLDLMTHIFWLECRHSKLIFDFRMTQPLCHINNFSLIAMDIIIFEELWILNGCNDSDIFSLLTHDRLFLCFPWNVYDLYLTLLKFRFWAKHATTYVSSAKNE